MAPDRSAPKRYLVTGAGSGIGLAVARQLAAAGHRVFACARRDEDLARLAGIAGASPLRLDLRDADGAAATVAALAAAGADKLDGLVNNAGIGELGHLAAWTDADVLRLFETNVFGLMRLTRELLPRLLAAGGRVVNIGSMGGSITQPLYGPYTMTKHALEAYSECLRLECAPHGVAVSIVQPGGVATRIGESASAANQARLAATPEPFAAEARALLDAYAAAASESRRDQAESAANRRLAAPEDVAAVVLQALLDEQPQARYLVGTRWEGERVLKALTTRLIDAATSPGQRLSREALLAWVDAAWRDRYTGPTPARTAMTPQDLLQHIDSGRLWPTRPFEASTPAAAYQAALAVRSLRIARGERALGFKIGFTNRTIWERYGVFAPIWGTVWNTTVAFCDGDGELALDHTCQPRIEPEAVFGFHATPRADATVDDLFDAIDWVASGFEIVQSHSAGWKFTAAETMADSGLHARLLVGRRTPLRELAGDAATLHGRLSQAQVELQKAGSVVDRGRGSNVLDSPLQALLHFVRELRACEGAPDIAPGDIITTGTWTDAWPVQPGESWQAAFDSVLPKLAVRLR